MNAQKVFDALADDDQNSALGTICGELEDQGYEVVMNDRPVTSAGFYGGEFPDLEQTMNPLDVSLLKDGKIEQVFSLKFVDFHEAIIQRSKHDTRE